MPRKKKAEHQSLGQKIKDIREKKGLKLLQLANETGASVQTLEEIEEGRTVPSVGMLLQISRALEVESDIFLEEKTTKKSRAKAFTKRTDNYAYTTLSPGARHKHMKAFKVAIVAGKAHKGVGYRHEGEEFIYVLKGQIEVMVGDNKNPLKTGDSLHFNSGIPHHIKNTGKTDAEMLVVVYTI